MSNINPYRLAGGKSNNILFLTHNDPSYASALRNRTAVLSWAEVDDSPTLLQTKSDFDIYALITAAYGHTPTNLNLIGSKGNYIYYKYSTSTPSSGYWIIEVDYTSWTITKRIMPTSSGTRYTTWLDGDSNILYAVTTSATNINLRKVLKYDYTSYNPTTMYFDTVISSFECLHNFGLASWNSSDPSISGDDTGFLSRWKIEPNETDIVYGGTYDIISYNSSYEETGQFSDAREKYLGWHCDRPNNDINLTPNGPLICGLPNGRMFTVDPDGLFYSSDTNTHIIEWDATTFQAIRTSKLDTGIPANPWIDADIQPSVALTGMSKGEKPDFQTSQNCTIIGLGALDSTIYTTMRYNFKENSVLSTSPNQYRVFKPDAPCDARALPLPPISEWCPATTYLVQKREWLVGNDEHTITMSSETDDIKPIFVNSPHPWWLKDIVVTGSYVFILLGANERQAIGYHWLLQCNASTMAVMRYKRLNVLGDDYRYDYVPWSIAGNASTIYVYFNGGSNARIEIIDVASFATIGIVQPSGYNHGLMRKIGGDGANGYIYSTYYTTVSGLTHLWLQKRDTTDFLVTSYDGVSEIDITSIYYPSSWVSPPSVSTDPRLWALGGGGNRLYLGGLDCINGTTNMLLYEFDPITLEFMRSSNICGAEYVPPRLNTQIISFW
jgi:hypothetical protein